MEVQKTITLNLEKRGKDKLFVKDSATLAIVVGTTAVQSQPDYYGVTRTKEGWIVPYEAIQKRIKKLECDVSSLTKRIDIMKQVLKK